MIPTVSLCSQGFTGWTWEGTKQYPRKCSYLSAPHSHQLAEHRRCGNSSLQDSGVPLCSETKNAGIARRKRLHLWLQRQRKDGIQVNLWGQCTREAASGSAVMLPEQAVHQDLLLCGCAAKHVTHWEYAHGEMELCRFWPCFSVSLQSLK